ncbi:hypothetical protein WA026_000604 [Henosepilachna vigintioctopunctata]|uniref:Nucleolar protein 12 n=1 Tax=Henosepilachna vigintioctopunctata TaxID=420089 RepID=A0AAW1UZ08_9CUCU
MPSGKSRNNKKPRNRTNKIHLVFDEEKRRDFLTGFHKRKMQRKKQAKEKFEKELKEEKKKIKSEARESYKKLVVSHRPIPELQHLLEEEYEDENSTVKIVELSTNEIAKQNNWIGANAPIYASDVDDDDDETVTEKPIESMPGMELNNKKTSLGNKIVTEKQKFNSEKDIKKKVKKIATKTVQKSKIFQMKNKIERQKQKKKSMRQRRLKDKMKEKSKFKNGKSR